MEVGESALLNRWPTVFTWPNRLTMKKEADGIVYSPSDLVRFLESHFASWMDRYNLEFPGKFRWDPISEDAQLVFAAGEEHERAVLEQLIGSGTDVAEIGNDDDPEADTLEAIRARRPVIYQARLAADGFAGYADFMILDEDTGKYRIWDTKLARSPKPYYAVQLCCYSEMFAAMTGEPMPAKFGIILGPDEHGARGRAEFRVEDYIHFYRHLKARFLEMLAAFDGDLESRPVPDPRADHGRWQSHANRYLDERDHLFRVAGISTGQIKKLNEAGITTLAQLAAADGLRLPKTPRETTEKLVHQARLQKETRELRETDPKATAVFEILPTADETGQPVGLGALPPAHPADVYFDMEGYPLVPGGLEFLFGNTIVHPESGEYGFVDFWCHNREEEKAAFEAFIDWVYARWLANPGMHIYHYAVYEVAAVRRLSTRHDTRQEEVDNLLRKEVFVDLFKIVRRGLRIGEQSYSLKKVERIYWPESRTGVVTLALGSVVHYARWIQSGEPKDWKSSPILKEIREYNKDDCDSTAELAKWLRQLAYDNGIPPASDERALKSADQSELETINEEAAARLELAENLRKKGDGVSKALADLVDFHRREGKPVWWRFFDRIASEPEVLRDDNGCIAEVTADGEPRTEKKSFVQDYTFDPAQECKLSAGEKSKVVFAHASGSSFNLVAIDPRGGTLALKAGPKTLQRFDGGFPPFGSLIPNDFVDPKTIAAALTLVAESRMNGGLNATAAALLERRSPLRSTANSGSTVEAAVEVARSMNGDCLVIQGPPGTGKTYTASHMIAALLADGKRVGVTSNGHKAIVNLLVACGNTVREQGGRLTGVKVGGEKEGELFDRNPGFEHVGSGGDAFDSYSGGVIGGTAWVFSRPEWEDELDFLFVDEAGQVSLANVVAMSRSARNLVLLGDQMQLEQPVQGSHPGDSGMSALQYALKDTENSVEDDPVYHAVVPSDYGLFLGESRRMYPAVCQFISESVYEGRLTSFADCSNQRIEVPDTAATIRREHGIVFLGVEHDGNVQQSDEEVERVVAAYMDLLGRPYTDSKGETRPLGIGDFLFIAPYNAQVRALEAALPAGARVGSVDKFQGQEAPVCVLSLCSSFGEYGSRGLGFILDQNRINVAVSRAKCLAIIVADPRIAETSPNSLADMKLLNLYCKLLPFSEI